MSQYVTKIRTNQGDKQIDYNALANLPAISNPNLLINGDFQVWQRGESFSNIANKYTADRWMIKNAKSATPLVEKSVSTPNGEPMCQSMHIKDTANENTYLAYNFEHAIKGTYTLSFWYFSTTQISTYIHDNGSYVKLMDLAASSVWRRAHVSFYANAVDFINIIHAMKAGECYITGIKLEVGTTATPFVPRSHAEEVVLCKRFCQTVNLYWRPGVVNSAGTIISFVADVLLRTLPSGSPLVTLYEVPTRIRTTSSNSVDTTLTLESVHLSNGMVALNIASSIKLDARSVAVPIDEFKTLIDAEIY